MSAAAQVEKVGSRFLSLRQSVTLSSWKFFVFAEGHTYGPIAGPNTLIWLVPAVARFESAALSLNAAA